MRASDKVAIAYFRHVKRHLICGSQSREQVQKRALGLIEAFAEENPAAQYADYSAAFGEPKEFAAEIVSMLDPLEVEQARKARRKTLILIWILIFALLAVVTAVVVVKLQDAQEIIDDSPVFYVVEKSSQDMSQQEVKNIFKE